MKNRISVIGLGYVGSTTAIGFAKLGYRVMGVDLIYSKVNKINKLNKKGLRATLDLEGPVLRSDISFVCVETPTKRNGELDLNPLKKVCKDLANVIGNKEYHLIVIRSTIFPGSLEILKKELEKFSGKKCGLDFDLATNPEFLREKTAMKDFLDPSYIVVGADNNGVGKKVMDCYNGIDAKRFVVKNDIAQMIKYVNNSWHACKVSFTNEVGAVCKKFGVNGDNLMNLFCADKKLNVSTYYHKIGGPFGGHCLPKDLTVLQNKIKEVKLKCSLIQSITESNKEQIKRGK